MPTIIEVQKGEYTLTTDPARLVRATVFDFLSNRSYWAKGLPYDIFEHSLEHSLCFSILRGEQQVAFARVVSDYATFAWVADVFVDEEQRGLGLGKWLMESMRAHPDLQNLRAWVLATRDAHGLYRQFGFDTANPQIYMAVRDPEVYQRLAEQRSRE